MKKRALSAIMATIMAVMPLSQVWITADAYEEPTDIKITVQTKDIDIDEIPEDRKVQLEVYTENCPPFTILSLYFEKDSRLQYDNSTLFSLCDDLKSSGNCGFNTYMGSPDCPTDIKGCTILAVPGTLSEKNGNIINVNLILPENVNEGDFFKMDVVRKFDDRGELTLEIALSNDVDSLFRDSSFSELNGGGIRITQDAPPPTEPPKTEPPRTEPPKQDNPPSNNGNGNNNNNNSGNGGSQNNTGNNNNTNKNNDRNNDKKTVTSVVTTSKQTTPTTSKSSTTERTTTITDTMEQTTSAESTIQTQPVITGMEENPPKKNKNGLFMFLIINGLIITMGGGVFIYCKRKKYQ